MLNKANNQLFSTIFRTKVHPDAVWKAGTVAMRLQIQLQQ